MLTRTTVQDCVHVCTHIRMMNADKDYCTRLCSRMYSHLRLTSGTVATFTTHCVIDAVTVTVTLTSYSCTQYLHRSQGISTSSFNQLTWTGCALKEPAIYWTSSLPITVVSAFFTLSQTCKVMLAPATRNILLTVLTGFVYTAVSFCRGHKT